MADLDRGIEAGFGTGEGLEEIGPKGALIGFWLGGEAGAKAGDGVSGGGGEQVRRQSFFDERVPGFCSAIGVAGAALRAGPAGLATAGGAG